MKFRFIGDHRSRFSVEEMCRVLKVSRSGYYARRNRGKSPLAKENAKLLCEIRRIHIESRGRYGSPRIYEELKSHGFSCSRPRVARLMRFHGIRSRITKKYKVTTKSKHKHPVSPNLLADGYAAKGGNEIWVSDITYVWTREGWLYLAAILDVFNRQIVGWSLSESLKKELVLHAIHRAMGHRQPKGSLIFHSDRGSQYASDAVRKLLNNSEFKQSMSGKGNCFDNAVMESFFHTLKTELVYLEDYWTRDQARQSIFEYIEVFYNRQRIHSSLGYLSPVEFERRWLPKVA